MCNWAKIQKDYFDGLSPKEICEKYPDEDLTPKRISDKAYRDNWKTKRNAKITKTKKIIEEVNEEIKQEIKPQLKEQVIEEINRTQRQLDLALLAGQKIKEALNAKFKAIEDKEGKIQYVQFDPKDLKAILSSLLDLQKIERIAEDLDKNDPEKDPNIKKGVTFVVGDQE